MPTIQTNKLTGPALDLAVAEARGVHSDIGVNGRPWEPPYSTDWAQGGPIIEREGISITETDAGSGEWEASIWINPDKHMPLIKVGPTPLIAAMRCFVASRLGDDVEIPNFADAA